MATQQGVILGTAAYMSPEQARGKAVDKKSRHLGIRLRAVRDADGTRHFQGEDVTEILAAVIRRNRTGLPFRQICIGGLREVLERCLKKDPKDRYHDISRCEGGHSESLG